MHVMSSSTKMEAPLPLQLHYKRKNTLNNTHVVSPDSFDQTMSPFSLKKLFCVIFALLSMAQSHAQLVEGKKVSNVQ